eukprot:6170160-Pyramimonas_sp.AAC.2
MGSAAAILRPPLIVSRLWKGADIVYGAVEGSEGTWIRREAVLGPLGGMSAAILPTLDVPWAILDAIVRR